VPWCHSVGFNNITGDAADHLATVVLEHAILTDFCGIPLVSLRENSIAELNLESKGIGEPGAIVLSKLLPSAAALTSLKCACRPRVFAFMSAPVDTFLTTCSQSGKQQPRSQGSSRSRRGPQGQLDAAIAKVGLGTRTSSQVFAFLCQRPY